MKNAFYTNPNEIEYVAEVVRALTPCSSPNFTSINKENFIKCF
ncbi:MULTISPECIES: hypothetical protein [unclassified Bacillus cereus group]|nr:MULTISPECIES: hypothetical protein [unclassified Bacillus cereus group]MEB9430162.1 hypothetical protein [Bacillus cereus]MEB9481634.1 hypothetical protein [Bacillus cereus]